MLPVIVLGGWTAAGEKSDVDKFVGTWRVTMVKDNGKDVPAELVAGMRMTFTKDGKVKLTIPKDTLEGAFKIVGAGQIDIAVKDTEKLDPGIYKLDGKDRLMICVADRGKQRPTEYTSAEGSRHVLIALTRAKAGEEKASKEESAKTGKALGQVQDREQSSIHMKLIGLAMHSYHDANKAFPTQAIYSKDGKKPLLSWRVAILPYIEEVQLYQQFKLDEPWDSDNNKKLIAKMPKWYATPGVKDKPGMTHYQVITGPGAPFNDSKKISLRDIVNDTTNTILAVEAKDPVIWTKPADLVLPKEKNKLPALGGVRKDGFFVVLFDGSIDFIRAANPAKLRPMMLLKGE
jgi:uncharacterized protein (TIGR03067 family)